MASAGFGLARMRSTTRSVPSPSVTRTRIVFLHQFAKKTDKTPAKELEIARRRKHSPSSGAE
jgi:phage-related protein